MNYTKEADAKREITQLLNMIGFVVYVQPDPSLTSKLESYLVSEAEQILGKYKSASPIEKIMLGIKTIEGLKEE